MSVTVVKHGLMDTMQDMGRYGYQHFGINPGGVVDPVAAAIANQLVGNPAQAAVIEMHFPAASFHFSEDAVIAISGADFSAVAGDEHVPVHAAFPIAAGTSLSFKRPVSGARCYLAVRGGWKAEDWLGSYSTNLKVRAGGYQGNPLRKGDELDIQPTTTPGAGLLNLDLRQVNCLYNPGAIRVVCGAQYHWLLDISKKQFTTSPFTISSQSDRMGYRMVGETLETSIREELVSSAVTRGAIQLLPSGQLVVLMADHQTTGGYPVVAHVITADFPSLAQKQVNEKVTFELVTIKEAEEAYMQQHTLLKKLFDK
ncbi:biotin-dependent carboxyltransferase family protein [Aridibaculum aurantiacum]|uniref:5-oxoprolinase subunit C family protein n=1 Tax=Aridibaculum aurantiacum TaxID=2810307 RepID=UPI001A961258|nr:biotin-dependent carboxyltransferase family protein [Aridibaculum aurantiacum]